MPDDPGGELEPSGARLDELVELVVALASGRLETRLPPSPASDALDAITVGLNMLGEELQALTGDLEERVAERTRELAAAREELHQLALYDPLTGLANRTLLARRIDHAMTRAGHGAAAPAVLVLDLDGFKAVNDGFGHLVGDQLLVAVAARLRGAVRDGDTVARLGGDEFAIVVLDAEPDEVLDVAARVQQAMAGPTSAGGHLCWVEASIGVCLGVPGENDDTILEDADTAMYAVKAHARGGVRVFEPAIRQAMRARTRLADELRHAVGSGRQLSLVYQPIVELATGRPVAVEALVRWRHPERGLLPPEAFVEVAEDTGLVAALDRWVLEAAAAQMARWRATVLGAAVFAVHVNVSPVGMRASRFTDDVVGCLSRHAVPAGDVVLEIAEHQTLSEDAATRRTVEELRAAGVLLAIDGFGSGSSSLTCARESLVDMVKIDRSMVRGLDVDAQQHRAATAVLALVDAFGLVAVAEGVETPGEADRLRALGYRYAQGRHWGLPRSADAVMDLWRAAARPTVRENGEVAG